jgi:S1-C subfamily serine protease
MSTLQDFSNAIAGVVMQASKFVVTVHAGTRFASTGVVWQPGVVVTTDHTVRHEEDLRITLPGGSTISATLVGRDPGTDLAILRFEGESEVRPAGSATAEPGHIALAIGRSADTGPNVAFGVVSAVGKPWRTWHGGQIDRYIRLDVSLYPGTSGAAVVDSTGALIGIATSAMSRIAPLAIPASTIDRVSREILSHGAVARPYIGVAVQPVPIPGGRGLIVLTVDTNTPAGKSGILVGDILTAVADTMVSHSGELQSVLARHSPGDTVTVKLTRGGEPKQIQVVLEDRNRRQN